MPSFRHFRLESKRGLMRKLSLASALFLAAVHFPVAAQDDRLGSITVVWGSDLSSGRLITLANEKQEIIKKFDWSKRKDPFFANIVLPEHEYTIHLPGRGESVQLPVVNNDTTFLQVDQYKTDNGEIGIQIRTWAGTPNNAVQEAVKALKESGDTAALEPIKLESIGYSFYFNTAPPWTIPPRPPKR
jgi:hypothetical protein